VEDQAHGVLQAGLLLVSGVHSRPVTRGVPRAVVVHRIPGDHVSPSAEHLQNRSCFGNDAEWFHTVPLDGAEEHAGARITAMHSPMS
jgi:hypothetical protein